MLDMLEVLPWSAWAKRQKRLWHCHCPLRFMRVRFHAFAPSSNINKKKGFFQVWIATDFEIPLSWVWHRYVLSSHDSKKPGASNLHRHSLTGNLKFTFWFPLAPWQIWQVVQELLVPGRVLGASAHQYWPLGIWRQRTRLQHATATDKNGETRASAIW